MSSPIRSLLIVCFAVSIAVTSRGQPFGLTNRLPVSTLRLPLIAPVFGYATTNAFGSVTFTDPTAIATPPGETNRLFVLEQNGIVAVITNLAAPNRTVFMDISAVVRGGVPTDEEGLLGLVFHPGFATNGYFYLYYSVNATTTPGTGRHQRLSRFQAVPPDANFASAATEAPLLTMWDEAFNHNGGDLHFGPDGYLYVALGDEGAGNDTLNNSQIITKDFWAGILRIDVDNRATNLVPNPHPAIHAGTYRVPSDNPFVGVTTWHGTNLMPGLVRTEFYAVGLRNPWRISFDPLTGQLYCGDVGQGAREEVDLIMKGGNYGWAFREGLIAGPKAAPAGAVRVEPILDYQRGSATNQGSSVTGGVVYRGTNLPALDGAYIFADYVSGNIWALRHNGATATNWIRLLGDTAVAAFGYDPRNGDVLLADQDQDTIKRLVFTTTSGSPYPPTLADTGAFTNTATLTPHDGIVAYDVNAEAWTDNAIASRWFYVPTNRLITFRATNNWSFPTGTVWIQHLELEMTNGAPASRRRLETRVLVRDAASGAYGLTYRWDSATNATLVPDAGLDESLVIDDGGGLLRTQVWHYPSRAECLRCHTISALGGLALGFNTLQLNRDHDYGGVTDNQLRALANAGYFTGINSITNRHALRFHVPLTDPHASLEQRLRCYLTVNCVACHQSTGPGGGAFDARLFASLPQTRLVNGMLNNNGGNTNARVVVPGDLTNSMLHTRVSIRDNFQSQMPPVGSTLVDTQFVALLSSWITNVLPAYQTFSQWQMAIFGSTNAPNSLADADPDTDGASNIEEYLQRTDPNAGGDYWAIGISRANDTALITYPVLTNRGLEVQWTTNLTNPSAWQFLNIPGNRAYIAGTNGVRHVPDSITNAPAKYYRTRVFEP